MNESLVKEKGEKRLIIYYIFSSKTYETVNKVKYVGVVCFCFFVPLTAFLKKEIFWKDIHNVSFVLLC